MELWLWLTHTLRANPELAIFLVLALGYWLGSIKLGSFTLGAVTGTLLVGVLVGQLNIEISSQIKTIFFLMFLFAVGFGVGPQFVKGLGSAGLPQALFAVVVCLLCLGCVYLASVIAGLGPGVTAGLLAGSQTISASIGLATDAILQSSLSPTQAAAELNKIPVAYAVTYLFGTVGTGWIIAFLGPKLLGIDLKAECARYEKEMTAGEPEGGIQSAWRQYIYRAVKLSANSHYVGQTVADLEHQQKTRLFVESIRRDGVILEASQDTILQAGDILAISGRHDALVDFTQHSIEVADQELLDIPLESIDVYITNKAADNKTLLELSQVETARGVYVTRIRRGSLGVDIPVLTQTQLHRGDIVTVNGTRKHVEAIIKEFGYADRPTTVTSMTLVGLGIVLGGLIGAVVLPINGIPITLSTSGGALIAGLICGWLRSFHPRMGNVPSSTLWFMNSVGLNVFIAVVGLTAGPTFIAGLEQIGLKIFLWGLFATGVPMILAPLIGKYIFKFDPAINLGCCGGARTSTASVAMVADAAQSNVPMLGYTVPYAVANTLLTLWGLVIILLIT